MGLSWGVTEHLRQDMHIHTYTIHHHMVSARRPRRPPHTLYLSCTHAHTAGGSLYVPHCNSARALGAPHGTASHQTASPSL